MQHLLLNLLSILFFNLFSLFSKNPHDSPILVDTFIFINAPFPSCHAATIVEVDNGLVAAWFGGTYERHPDVGIWVSRFYDNQWTPPVEVANGVINDTLRYPCWNPVLFKAPDGELILFYKVGPKPSEWKGYIKRSYDNGISWTDAEVIPEGFLGPVKNKPIIINDSILIHPSSTEGNGWKIHFEISDVKAKKWFSKFDVEAKNIDAIQPTLLIHDNKKIQAICRTRNRYLAETWSYDGGKHWTKLKLISLPSTNSGIDAITLKDGTHLLVYNHVFPEKGKNKGPRTPLNIAISKDGKNWYASLVLESDPEGQYSYPSVIQSNDGLIHIVYTWKRERIKYVKIDPSKLKLYPIKDEKWPESLK